MFRLSLVTSLVSTKCFSAKVWHTSGRSTFAELSQPERFLPGRGSAAFDFALRAEFPDLSDFPIPFVICPTTIGFQLGLSYFR